MAVVFLFLATTPLFAMNCPKAMQYDKDSGVCIDPFQLTIHTEPGLAAGEPSYTNASLNRAGDSLDEGLHVIRVRTGYKTGVGVVMYAEVNRTVCNVKGPGLIDVVNGHHSLIQIKVDKPLQENAEYVWSVKCEKEQVNQ